MRRQSERFWQPEYSLGFIPLSSRRLTLHLQRDTNVVKALGKKFDPHSGQFGHRLHFLMRTTTDRSCTEYCNEEIWTSCP
jgi:hypothetical protein